MIKSFNARHLLQLFQDGNSRRIAPDLQARCKRLLRALDVAEQPADMDTPGWAFHELKGDRKGTYSVSVNGPWRITFGCEDGNPCRVDLEHYH